MRLGTAPMCFETAVPRVVQVLTLVGRGIQWCVSRTERAKQGSPSEWVPWGSTVGSTSPIKPLDSYAL